MLRQLTLSALLLLTAPLAAQEPTTANPEALVRTLYAHYRTGGAGIGDEKVVALLAPATRVLFERALKLDAEQVAIEADPFCDCQDFNNLTLQDLRITPVDQDRATARVSITDSDTPIERREIALALRRTPQGWRIEDAGPVAGWSLLRALQTAGTRK